MINKTPDVKPFGELSKKKQNKLFQAWLDGADIESWSDDQECWYKLTIVPWWAPVSRYRIKPKSETEAPTPDSIDWSHLHDSLNFVSRNSKGRAFASSEKPHLTETGFSYMGMFVARVDLTFASYKQGTVDWKDSLIERPEIV